MNYKKRRIVLYAIASILLLVPLVAMQFSKEVNWSLSDFLIGGFLLFGTATVIDFILRIIKKKSHRIILSIVTLLVLMIIWGELAVGIFGTPFAGN